MIVADPLRPGGILSGLPAGLLLPILDYTTRSVPDSQYDIVVLKQEYDGIADFPDRPWNLLADANALAGIVYLHFREHDGAELHRHTGDRRRDHRQRVWQGKTTTYLLPDRGSPADPTAARPRCPVAGGRCARQCAAAGDRRRLCA